MCGICGAYNANGIQAQDQAIVHSMMDALSHRGPDGEGFWASKEVALGHRRLAIIDLAGGYQPQFNETKDIGVICNGEIYNYRELRRELSAHGHQFRTSSDTEVLVHAYEQWGDECVHRFRGMFAFGIWDVRRRRLLLVRDRLGVKPLYWAFVGDRLLFASEIKAILGSGLIAPRPHGAVFSEVLATRGTAGVETMFEGIYKLLPGHRLIFEDGRVRTERYWELPLDGPDPELNRLGATLPIIFVSGHGDIPMSVRALQHGAVRVWHGRTLGAPYLERQGISLAR